MFEHPTRKFIMLEKLLKRKFKNKDEGDPFLRTVKLSAPGSHEYNVAKMKLDTGCEAHNLIDLRLVHEIGMLEYVRATDEVGCICLNGEELDFVGMITLQWKGKRFRKIFRTDFYVVEQDILLWQVILGAKTIDEHGILKFAGFGGRRVILPKESKEETKNKEARKKKHEEEAKRNDAQVKEHKKKREEAQRNGNNGKDHHH